jgi:CheY-like chemotaxis protein
VLWVDDKPHTILGERRLLRALGVTVISAKNSEEALAILEQDNDFDVLISDVQRRGKCFEKVTDGGAVVRRGRRHSDDPDRSYAVLFKEDGTKVVEIHDGVNFVAGVLRSHPDRTLRELPIIFYSAYGKMSVLENHTQFVRGARLCNRPDTLIRDAVRMIADVRANPIEAPSHKKGTKAAPAETPLAGLTQDPT